MSEAWAILGAAAISVAAHLAAVSVVNAPAPEPTEIGGASGLIKLGNSFQDIAGGVTAPSIPEMEQVEPEPVEALEAAQSVNALVAEALATERAEETPREATDPSDPPETPSPEVATQPPSLGATGAGGARQVMGEVIGAVNIGGMYSGEGEGDVAALTDADISAAYGNAVLQAIKETEKERTPMRGSAKISFAIASTGDLASVDLIESSGNDLLDDIGLNHIRRAAPFPPPPEGAQRRFTIAFKGR